VNEVGFGDTRRQRETNPARMDAAELADQAAGLLDQALGASWYEEERNPVDLAVLALCRLRRAGAGDSGGVGGGDAAVRAALGQVDVATALWVASRAISYMDEHGFPESLDPSLGRTG
jgi:hypothetical protein